MYLWIPLLFIAGLLMGIFIIIFRKIPYLRKLPAESGQDPNSGFWYDLFPEFFHGFKKINFASYRQHFFKEAEKFFRRLRVASLKLERLSDFLINRIQTESRTTLPPAAKEEGEEKEKVAETINNVPSEAGADAKDKERRLIIEIAKSPKNPEWYKQLGDIYLSLNNLIDAKKSLEVAVKLDPEDSKIKEKLRQIEEKLKMPE